MEVTILGTGVSPGVAIGPAFIFGAHALDVPKHNIDDHQAEIARFQKAREAVRDELIALRDQTHQDLGKQHADIFASHIMAVDDVELEREINERVASERLNVEFLVDEIIGRHTKILESVEDAQFRERVMDFADVGRRILGHLMNTGTDRAEEITEPCVLVAHELTPSETANLEVENTLGIATDHGGPTSHTAILARALQIPAVVGVKDVDTRVQDGDTVVVDGSRGLIIVNPEPDTLEDCKRQKERADAERLVRLEEERGLPSVTADGVEIPTLANIELPIEMPHALNINAMGVGLYRTEFMFLNRDDMPSEEEQFTAYASVVEQMKGGPVTLRTLDLGGDKLAKHLQYEDETNPQLGWRAIRLCLERPDIFKQQLRAILRASAHGNVRILFPLISGVDEFRRAKAIVLETCKELESRGIPFDPNVKLGTMIEVPSAVAVADLLARECDYFSLGTNDLIQYTLAVDRGNEKIAHMYEPAHPAILRYIHQTAQAAHNAGIPCSICGEMAGDGYYTELLLGLGVTALSMASVSIPNIRATIAEINLSEARDFAQHVLKMESLPKVKSALRVRHQQR